MPVFKIEQAISLEIEDFIDAGIEVLNPLQPECKGFRRTVDFLRKCLCANRALYYKDGVDFKSLYTVGLVLAMLDVYDVTKEQEWLDKAIFHDNWMVSLLGRTDGLYWTDARISGALGQDNPKRIQEAGSVSFLAGNQAMCVIAKRLYDIKKDEAYMARIKKTSLALSTIYNNNGIYLNDRDAWTNGTFMSDFAKMIAADSELAFANADLILATARSIVAKDVTEDGYYGGSWQGPAGKGSKWTDGGSVPEQIMTSGTTVHVLVAAAILNQLFAQFANISPKS